MNGDMKFRVSECTVYEYCRIDRLEQIHNDASSRVKITSFFYYHFVRNFYDSHVDVELLEGAVC
jgi:hypothetical protein